MTLDRHLDYILITKDIICDKCKARNHYEDCLKTVEKDIRQFKLKSNETLANLAHFQTGQFKYVFRCTCPCSRDPLYQISYYNQIFPELL
jgi:hypothetical protein